MNVFALKTGNKEEGHYFRSRSNTSNLFGMKKCELSSSLPYMLFFNKLRHGNFLQWWGTSYFRQSAFLSDKMCQYEVGCKQKMSF
ncbi:hypothetical protein DN748_03915 [Sinomicrobium soli]|nr:hypothetical protein DN748_03915 [Sinomicrobium sp. N-1-3-6]